MIWEWDGKRFEECCVFHKVKEEWGGLSNMSNDFPLRIGEIGVGSSEALYQALRFPHQPDWQREVLEAPHAMRAKMTAKKEGHKKNHSRADWDRIQVEAMKWYLRVKLAQHFRDFFVRLLRWTAPHPIVELSRKDRFWGAVQDEDGVVRGENMLGRPSSNCEMWPWRSFPRESKISSFASNHRQSPNSGCSAWKSE